MVLTDLTIVYAVGHYYAKVITIRCITTSITIRCVTMLYKAHYAVLVTKALHYAVLHYAVIEFTI